MKKSLSLILAIAMVFSMFSSIAFAQENDVTPEAAYEVLADAGIFRGVNDAGDPALNWNMTRAQFATVLTRLFDLTPDRSTPSYSDTADHWGHTLEGAIEAVTTAEFLEGVGQGLFDPDSNVTIEQLAIIFVRALELEIVADAAVEGTVSSWSDGFGITAEESVATAIANGLIDVRDDYTVAATRAELVLTSYVAYNIIDDVEPVSDVVIRAVGARKIEVAFSNPVSNTAAATFSIRRGTLNVNISSIAWNDANTVATITTAANFTEGDYVVTVGGVVDPAVTTTLTLENQRAAEIVFASDRAPIVRDSDSKEVTVAYSVLNQYGEDVTSTNPVSVTVGRANVVINGVTSGNVSTSNTPIEIESTGTAFVQGERFSVNLLVSNSNVFASQVVEVSAPARISTIEVKELYHSSNATLRTNSTASQYYLLLDAKDQYGNSVTSSTYAHQDLAVSAINNGVISFATHPDTHADQSLRGQPIFSTVSNSLALQLAAPPNGLSAGTATYVFISTTTGNRADFPVEVLSTARIDTLSLTTPELVVAGERVKIEYEAINQFGENVTSYSVLSDTYSYINTLQATVNNRTVPITFSQNYATNSAELYLDLRTAFPGDAPLTSNATVFISAVTSTGKLLNTSFVVRPNATPAQISGLTSAVNTTLASNAISETAKNRILVVDQYGREAALSTYPASYDYRLVSSTTGNVDVTPDYKTLLAGSAGTANITATLYNGTAPIQGSEYTFTARTVGLNQIASYQVDDFVGNLYAPGTPNADYAKSLVVTGQLADGTSVALPKTAAHVEDFYKVVVTGPNPGAVNYDPATQKLSASNAALTGSNNDVNTVYRVVVTGFTNSGPVTTTKDITVSGEQPRVTALNLRGPAPLTLTDGVIYVSQARDADGEPQPGIVVGNASALANLAVRAVDQYGVEITTNKFSSESVSNFSNSGRASINQVVAGDSFNVSVVTPTALSTVFRVVVTN